MNARILVMDEDPAVRARIRALVEPLGVHVDESADAGTMAAAAARTGAAVVLVDLDADPKAAFAAVDTLKANPATSDVQVLALSTNLDSGRTAGATEHAFEDFLSKPIQEKELVPLLRFHLDLPHGLNDAHPL